MLVLLRPEADSPQLTGEVARSLPGEAPYTFLRYDVLRVWQLPPEQLLADGVGTLALAPIGSVSKGDVPEIIERVRQRLERVRERELAQDVWAAIYVLLGLRYSRDFAKILLRRVLSMKESVTYQAIIEEGGVLASQKLLLLAGKERFGKPDEATVEKIHAIEDAGRLELLMRRAMHVNSWAELLPPTKSRRRPAR